MRKLKLFFACLLMAVLSIGQMWGAVYFEDTFSDVGTGSSGSMLPRDGWSGSGTTAPQYNTGVRLGASSSGATLTKAAMSNIEGTKSLKVTIYVSRYNTNANTLTVTATNGTIASATLAENVSTGSGLTDGTLTIKPSANAGVTSTTAAATWTDAYKTEFTITGASKTTTITFSSSSRLILGPVKIEDAASTPSTCTSEITITKADDPANGTFALDNSGTVCIDEGNAIVNVTATPAAHYHLASVTSTAGTIGSIAGNTCEITDIDADTEIGVTFAEDTKYVVTWNVNGNEDTKTNVYAGEKPVFPATPAACDATSTTFIGWATAPWTGKLADLSEKTVYTSASAMPDVDAAVTYYAVFAKSSGSASNLFSWAGGTKEELTAAEGVADLNADNSDYADTHAPYRVKWNGTGKYIIISVASQPGQVSAGFKMIGGGTTSTITVQEADDAEGPFTDVENLAISGSSNDVVNIESTQAFKSTTRAIKLYYTKGSNVGLGPISIEGAVSMSDYMTTCCTQYNVNIAAGIENGSVSADVAKACEGATITLTFTPAFNYHLSAWTLNGAAQDVNANTFSMPAGAATVSATFEQDACEPLATPVVTVSGKAYPYDAVKLAWTAIEHADAYKVYIYDNEDNELEHNDAFAGVEYTIGQTLSASTTYKYSVQAISNTPATYCPSVAATGSFVTEALPTAHLTLIDLEGEHASSGDYPILTPFALPTEAASCSKEFYGWTSTENYSSEDVAPEYKAGDNFTFANTTGVTLYAVYADGGEEDETITPSAVSGTEDPYSFTIDKSGYTLSANKNAGSTAPAWNSGASDVRVYAKGDVVLTSSKTMTSIVFNLSAQGKSRLAPITASVGSIAAQAEGDKTVTWTGSATSVTFTVGDKATYSSDATKAGQLCFSNIVVTVQGEFSNYSTTCVDAPVATPSTAALSDIAAAGTSGTITMTYENVNTANVAVSVWSNEACTEAIEGNWLTATLNGDKNIEYTIAEYNSYASDRSAYIKLTAPETNGATAPDIVKIPVTQLKKEAVFTSLEDLALSDVPANTNVTVSFSNVPIKSIYYYPTNTSEDNRKGVVFDIKKAGQDIKIYYNAKVSEEWVAGGKLSGTLTNCPWKIYGGGWQLAPADWAWSNLTYTAPPAIDHIEIRGTATYKTYIDGQAFDPAGLSVIAIYDNSDEEDVTTFAAWTYDPEKLSEGDTEVEVTAEYNSKSVTKTIDELVVNPIPNKTIAQFIAAGGTRCYLEGTVSNYTNTNKGYFDITDASGTLHIYGCTSPSSFTEGDKIKVIAEEYEYYQSTTHEAKNVVYVSKVSAATIAIDDIDDMVVGDEILLSAIEATITPVAAQSATINYAVTEGTAVTIEEGKIKATAEGEATITASIEAGEGYLAGSTTFTVTVGPAPEPFDGDYFVKVAANSELTAGEYLIVYEDGALAFKGSLETLDASSNTIAVTFDHGKIQGTTDVLAATFTVKLAGTIQSASGYYIGQNSDANGLSSSTETQFNNAISIDADGNAVIVSGGGAYLRYNPTSGQERFRYFKSSTYTNQQAIALYKKENAAPVYETVRTGLTVDKYYTICLDKKVIASEGASFWNMRKRGTDIAYIEEHTGELTAGTPYIFQAEAEELKVVYEGAAVGTPVANGALRGTFENMIQDDLDDAASDAGSDIYLLSGNKLWNVTTTGASGNSLAAGRAYIVYNALEEGTPSYAPGKRVRAVPMQGQTATDIDEFNVSETPVKMIIDGQMYILRGEKMYDATGKLVK